MCEDGALAARRCVAVVPRLEVLVARKLALAEHLAREDDARVGLAVEEPDEDGGDGGGDEEDPEDPAPADALGEEAAADGTEDGAEEGPDGVDGRGTAALLGGEKVADDAAADGEAAGATDTGEEAEDDEALDVGGEGASNLPHGKKGVGVVEDSGTAVDLRERGEEEGTDLERAAKSVGRVNGSMIVRWGLTE